MVGATAAAYHGWVAKDLTATQARQNLHIQLHETRNPCIELGHGRRGVLKRYNHPAAKL
jgi:hypothetical protein